MIRSGTTYTIKNKKKQGKQNDAFTSTTVDAMYVVIQHFLILTNQKKYKFNSVGGIGIYRGGSYRGGIYRAYIWVGIYRGWTYREWD